MKKLMALGLLASSFVFADEGSEVVSIMKAPAANCEVPVVEASYRYGCVGIGPLPVPLPLVGIGGRYQKGHHGFDGSLQGFSIILINVAKINANYLYYFNPNLDSQWYIGAGAALFGVLALDTKKVYLAPQLVIGKQYTNIHGSVRHFQVEIAPYVIGERTFPTATFSYGFSF